MADHRRARLNEQFKREISQILAEKVRDPRVGRILVTEARVTPDLWLARIFVRPLGDAGDVAESLKGLEIAAPFIRRELGKVLRLRRIPELRFQHDTTPDFAERIEAVLAEVLPENEGDGHGGVDEPAPDGGGMDASAPDVEGRPPAESGG